MQSVSQLLAHKKNWNEGDHGVQRIERVYGVSAGDTVLDAARMMNEHRVGSLIVTSEREALVGIISERDILTRVVTGERDPGTTRVREVMTREVVSCDPSASLEEVRQLMSSKRIRHIPVLENGSLVGMVSIGDLNAASNADLSIEVNAMRAYIAS